jgi:hypothetical protein
MGRLTPGARYSKSCPSAVLRGLRLPPEQPSDGGVEELAWRAGASIAKQKDLRVSGAGADLSGKDGAVRHETQVQYVRRNDRSRCTRG